MCNDVMVLNNQPQLNVQTKPVEPLVEGGAQIQQVLNIECLTDFSDAPLLNIKFRYGGALQNLTLKLPVTINKFFQPTEMSSHDFFQRWKQLSQPQQEAQKIFKANHSMDTEVLKAKLLGLGSALLDNVDPNPENYVCAGVIQTKSQQVGCLLRLEPNAQAQWVTGIIFTSTDMVWSREREAERPPLSVILPRFYLGAESDVTQDRLASLGISYVLSVSRCSPQPSFLPRSRYLRIPIDDSLWDDLLPWIPQALHFIDAAMSSGASVLVHCAAGISRSPALAVAYIMYSLGMDLDHAYRYFDPSLNRHLTVVEGFVCPNDPRSYVVGGITPLVGSPMANRS
ncbi:hypothetical protein L3Q82_002906 [Scortum barcoo]|uniref:Uncharacterized protein n=1 Tax=Scortum barcoo TaxID=214431 RepID=A0ACB8VUZ1_9TELE|nr:hypothetical protein L3Q82_002906 [Scortum barcoo]